MKKLKKIIPCFLVLGVTCLLAKGLLTQNTSYHQYLVSPTESVVSQVMVFDDNIQDKKIKKEKYKRWTEENIRFFDTLKIDDPAIKEKINNIPIIINDGSNVWDKLSVVAHHKIATLTSKELDHNAINIATGRAIQFNEILEETTNENQKVELKRVDFGIYIGLPALEDKEHSYTSGLSKIFTEQQKYDYVFLHELSHFISKEMLGNEHKTESQIYELVLSEFEKVQGSHNFQHSQKDKEMIVSQYKESVADVLAVQFLYKKYPELIKKDIPHQLAKLRASTTDSSHLNVLALNSAQQNNYDSLEDMLSYARQKALENTEFFSTTSYANDGSEHVQERKKLVKLTSKFQAQEHVKKIRQLYLEVEKDLNIKSKL